MPMQITIDQIEIEEAIIDYIKNKGLSFNSAPEITLTASRGAAGFTASIDLASVATVAPTKVSMGPGSIDILDKPKTDTDAFKPKESTEVKTSEKKNLFETPVEKEIVTDDLEEEEPPVDPVTADTLFAS